MSILVKRIVAAMALLFLQGLAPVMAPVMALVMADAGAPPEAASIHINQVALERLGPKVAVVDVPKGARLEAFRVMAGGKTLFTGPLTPQPAFDDWQAGRDYYRADFSAFDHAGTVALEVDYEGAVLRSAPVMLADHALFNITARDLLHYFKANRHTGEADHHIRIFGSDRFVDVWGGWKDAGGDNGKYLSHLSYANFFNPQQSSLVPWALAKAYEAAPGLFKTAGLEQDLLGEVMWGADYLTRNLDADGYFYMTVFDQWGTPGAERVVTAYTGIDGIYSEDYRAAFREGAGMAIAALARASRLSTQTGVAGERSAATYLADAQKAFAHLQSVGGAYCDDGVENIIDDYTALVAATELYRSTEDPAYLTAARARAGNLIQRQTAGGWFVADAGSRPYYHGADAGLPVIALVDYAGIESDAALAGKAKATVARALDFQLKINASAANPFDYARQLFQTYDSDTKTLEPGLKEGFFLPHANETGYWWQGESARLASLTAAALAGGRLTAPDAEGTFGVPAPLAAFAQSQIDWTLGRNPYDLSMLYGFGIKNPPYAESGGDMEKGGISNGITGAHASREGRGITFAPGPDEENWRWVEQWLPHSTWFLLAVSMMAAGD